MEQSKDKKLQLTTKQLKAIQTLLAEDTMGKAAKEAGVTRNTLYRWLEDDLFMKELSRCKRLIINQGLMKLQKGTNAAVETLIEVAKDREVPPSARVAASREILNNTFRSLEAEDLEERISSIELKLSIRR